jgi:hypothetical protein
MTARKKRPARDGATPEKIKSGRKTGKTPSKDRPYRAILRRWAFRPMIRIASRLAQMNGWTEEQVTALQTGTSTSDAKIDVLTGLVRDAAANSGNVTDATWNAAQQAGWSDEQQITRKRT